MPLVYASDVIGDDRKVVKKRGDEYTKSDAKSIFNEDDGKSLIEDGVIVLDSTLPENNEGTALTSLNAMEALNAREKHTDEKPPATSKQ